MPKKEGYGGKGKNSKGADFGRGTANVKEGDPQNTGQAPDMGDRTGERQIIDKTS